MNLRKFFLSTSLIFLFSIQSFFAASIPNQINGISLSNQVYNFLNNNDFNPKKENLISNGRNNFPYNIIVNFNQTSDIKKNVIFVFNQDDVYNNQNLIKQFCKECKNSNFPITILFSYDSADNFINRSPLTGTSIFIQNNIDTAYEHTAIIINFSQEKNSIVTASRGKTSPSWLVKSLYNLILQNNLDFNLPPYYLSQLFTFNFSKDRNLDEFFDVEIPCVKLTFSQNNDINQMSNFILDTVHLFNEFTPMNFDQHFLLINLFGQKYLRMNEQFMVVCVILIILVFLVFLFLLFFIDSRRRNSALLRLKNNWHPVVFTFIIILSSFLLGKGGFLMFQKNITNITRVFVLYIFQMIISLVLCFIFFTYEYLHNPKADAHAVQYTVILSTFLNQFIFLYVDISLFPIFSIVCILSVAARYFKKPQLQIPIVILMAVPFLFYAYLLLSNSQITELKRFLLKSESSLLVLSFILCPIYLQLDCIFISFSKRAKNKKQIRITTSIIVSIFCFVVITFTGFYAHLGRKNDNDEIIRLIPTKDSKAITVNCSDSTVFDDKVITLSLKIPQETVACEIRLECENGSPILYSDNTYFVIDQNTASFVIPSNPPEKMWFTFGTSKNPMDINITIFIPDSVENQFIMKQKTVKISS